MIKLRKVSVHNLKGIDLDLPIGCLIVICGRSGSGKSSLAIDTLYAEGRRRYIETFSTYARQFLEKFEKPDALRIDGIPVSVAVTGKIDLKLNCGTVGDVTGITDYLRLLFAKIGNIFCPNCNSEITTSTPEKIFYKLPEMLASLKQNQQQSHKNNNETIIETKIQIVFEPTIPIERNDFIRTWRERGFVRCIIFGKTCRIDESEITTDLYEQLLRAVKENKSNANNNCNNKRELPVLIVVDRFVSGGIERLRFIDSVRLAYRYGGGECCLLFQDVGGAVKFHFAQRLFCVNCGLSFPSLEPQLFNPDSPLGICPDCCGVKSSSVNCSCGGSRLSVVARSVRVGGRNIVELCGLRASNLRDEISRIVLQLSDYERLISGEIIGQVLCRLSYLEEVGLGYLSVSRLVGMLSVGECRRVYLSGALGSNLVEIMYVLDEPSVGLHPSDSERLLKLVYRLRDNGNTVIVVEHEEVFLRGADWLVELGLGAGEAGGNIIFQGTPEEMLVSSESLTGRYLRLGCVGVGGVKGVNGSELVSDSFLYEKDKNELGGFQDQICEGSGLRDKVRKSTGRIRISGCCGNNLRDISVSFPLGQLCVVTGVSGAGKSTLIFDTLYPAVCNLLGKKIFRGGLRGGLCGGLLYDKLGLTGELSDVVSVTHGVPLKSGRSNPATYLKIFDGIREVFASTSEARLRNYGAGRFSFNVSGGRCESCLGEGFMVVDMQFMSDMYICCPECRGRRYRADTLEVLYRGKNISEVLMMTAREAFIFFRGQVKLQCRLKRMVDVGLDYIRLGQRLDMLSSGELQRLKLASYLVRAGVGGGCLLLFEEPTTGLHFADVEQLLKCFDMLIGMGHSLIVIEHNLQVIRAADHIIDIGPGAADQGGKIIAEGAPKEIAKNKNSKIAPYLNLN